MLTKLFSRKQAQAAAPPGRALSYDEQKTLLQDSDATVRTTLAHRPDARPEVLYYLADDAEAGVRQAVAANPATPVQADDLLSRDDDDDVRCDLALKIARMVPEMPADEQEKVRDLTLDVLERLARDQLPRVRAILAEELKYALKAPPQVIRMLAEDVEEIVAAPILEFSPLLSDADLREIIAAGCAEGALSAIARRRDISEELSDAVVATYDVPAVATLLTNRNARIRQSTLDSIAENAADVEAWHQPLVMRPELSIRAVRRIAGFVATSLVEILARRRELDDDTARHLRDVVQERLNETTGEIQEREERQANDLDARNLLDDEAVADAIEANRRDFVVEALSLRSGFAKPVVEKLLRSQNAKAVTALAWKADLSMRTALRLQSNTAHIPPAKMLYARNGTDFPLSGEDMAWQLETMV